MSELAEDALKDDLPCRPCHPAFFHLRPEAPVCEGSTMGERVPDSPALAMPGRERAQTPQSSATGSKR